MKIDKFMKICENSNVPNYTNVKEENYNGFYHYYQENPYYDPPNSGRVIVEYHETIDGKTLANKEPIEANYIKGYNKSEAKNMINEVKNLMIDDMETYKKKKGED